ncbi:MAG TPA: amidase [Spirochaetia bacterium]|nr:amidase [Spirochaetia bacterium]
MYHAPIASTVRGRTDDDLRAGLAAILDRVDSIEPHVHALLPEPDRRERVLAEMETLLARYPEPASRPPLFGVPVGVKDIFHADGFRTRAGSRLPASLLEGPEASTVSRLLAAGAIIIGKTVTTEFAYFQPGPTRNPWNLEHTPGGSSSGSAAAVSAGYAPLALGTQTIGSINRPAAFCGIVGFKPSYGRVATDGVIPFSASADHVGLLTASTAWARLGASVLWEAWRDVAPTASRATILVLDDAYTAQADDETRDTVAAAAERLEAAGHSIVRLRFFDGEGSEGLQAIDTVNETHNRMIAREFADVHRVWSTHYRDRYSPRSLELIERGWDVGDTELDRAIVARLDLRRRVDALLREHEADAILTPSSQTAAPLGIDATGSPIMNLPWTYAGVPTVTLPASRNPAGLPLGVQLCGAYGRDEELLALASAVETTVAVPVATG